MKTIPAIGLSQTTVDQEVTHYYHNQADFWIDAEAATAFYEDLAHAISL